MTDYPFNADKPVKADTIANFCVYTEQNAEHLMRSLYGFVRRSKFRWKDADEIYIGPGCYHHYGSTRNRLVWWNSELTYKFGSGGSNAASDDLGNNQWHYLFIDDSAVNTLASNELTVAEFLNDTTAPTWSDAKHGWYTGNDRCIGAFLTGGSADILEFYHLGDNLVLFADAIAEAAAITPSNTFTDVDCATSMPAISQKALISVYSVYSNATATIVWRQNGQTGSAGHDYSLAVSSASQHVAGQLTVYTDTSQIFEIKFSGATTNNLSIKTDGWYLPVGM